MKDKQCVLRMVKSVREKKERVLLWSIVLY